MPIIIPETIVPWTLRVNGISPFSLGFMTPANIFSSPIRPSNLLFVSRVSGHNCNVFALPALRRFSHSISYAFKDNPFDIGTSFLGIDSRTSMGCSL